jgi:dodecin
MLCDKFRFAACQRAGFERGASFSHENACRSARSVRRRNEVYSQEDTMAKQQRMQVSPQKASMAEQQADTVYKIVDVVGVSEKSWEEAGRNAVETAAGSLRDLRVAEVTKMDMKVENGKVAAFRTRVSLSFKYGGWSNLSGGVALGARRSGTPYRKKQPVTNEVRLAQSPTGPANTLTSLK